VAVRLAQHGNEVVLYEREPVPGGLAAGFPLGNAYLEKFYHHLFKTDRDAVELINEMGLGDRLVWRRPSTVMLRDGRLWPLDSAGAVLRFDPLPLRERLRMGAVTALLKVWPWYRVLEEDTASWWLSRWMGDAAFRSVWQPLLASKFGSFQNDIAMPWFWARVHYRTASLGYLRGGFQQLYDSLTFRLAAHQAQVRLGTEVRAIRREHGRLHVEADDGHEIFDRVVSTLPTRITMQLTPGLPEGYRDRFGGAKAYGAMCLILALSERLTRAYWINIGDSGYPFQPLVEHTNLMPSADYHGYHLLYLGNYLPMDSELMSASKEEVLAQFLPHLTALNPSFRQDWVRESWLYKAPFAQPIVTREFARTIPPHVTPLPGLFMANMFQIYPQDRGQNYSIRMANRLVSWLQTGLSA